MTVGIIILLIVSALIFFGLLQRVLDRMRLNDRTAILFIGAMIVGSFLPNIPLFSGLSINIGGGIIPIVLVIYLLVGAETYEKTRAISASIITGGTVYAASKLLGADPGDMILDPIYMFSIIAGLVAYITTRSRRTAFIAGIMGIVLNDIAYVIEMAMSGLPSQTAIGGAGVLDTTVISGMIAVGLAEIIGETREKLQSGPNESNAKGNMGNEIEDISPGKEVTTFEDEDKDSE
ncbi:MAG TPA: DUF1614 domain-containing protein [Thermoanaerobacterales bacterium]|nr:DUF1614 domain-containing protein [Thermoanaerobacterales bacterium]